MPRRKPISRAVQPAPPVGEMQRRVTEATLRSEVAKAFEPPPATIVFTSMERQRLLRERQVLEQALVEEIAQMGLADFWFFFTGVLFKGIWEEYYSEEFHKPLADRLQRIPPGSNIAHILFREARKTYLILGYILWLIVRDPNIRIQFIGAKKGTVKKWSLLIRSAFFEGTPGFEEFQRIYAQHIYTKEETKRKDLPLEVMEWSVKTRDKTLADATFFATYLGVTGAGSRCDVQIFDDPFERRNCSNPQQSAKSLMQMMDLFPLVETSGKAKYRNRIINATRWAYHDPVGVLIGEKHEDIEKELSGDAKEKLPSFDVIVRHALEDPNRPCEVCPPHVMARHPHGHPTMDSGARSALSPIITREDIEHRLDEYCTNPELGESLFWHQYMNVCMAPSSQRLKPDWFLSGTFPCFPTSKRRVLAVDTADKDFAQEATGDFMVAHFGEFDDFGRLLLVNGLRSNSWTRDEFIRRIVVWCRAIGWWPQDCIKEKFGHDKSFMTDLKSAFDAETRPARYLFAHRPINSLGTVMKKWDYIVASLQAPLERGEIIFGSEYPKPLKERTIYEGINLGQTKNEDAIETLALFYDEQVRIVAAPKSGVGVKWSPPTLDLYQPEPVAQVGQPMMGQLDYLLGGDLGHVLDDLPGGHTVPWRPPGFTIKVDI